MKIGLLSHGTHGCLRKKEPHIWSFCFSAPTMEQTFVKSLNARQKPEYHQRIILPHFKGVAIDHLSSVSTSTTLPSLVIVSTSTASLSSSHDPAPDISQTILKSS